MKINNLFSIFFILFVSCDLNQDKDSFDNLPKTKGGLVYQIHGSNGGEKPEIGDILEIHLAYGVPDSPFFNSWVDNAGNPLRLQLSNPDFPGAIDEGLVLMSRGDSATFWIPIDSVFKYMLPGEVPPSLKHRTILRFDVRMVNFSNEVKELQMFLHAKGLDPIQKQSGILVAPIQAGTGKEAKAGKRVRVNYNGYLLNGDLFNTTYQEAGANPLEFLLGHNQVILGWDEAIANMREGEKIWLGVPSYLAYGSTGIQPTIPAYASLIFELELVSVLD